MKWSDLKWRSTAIGARSQYIYCRRRHRWAAWNNANGTYDLICVDGDGFADYRNLSALELAAKLMDYEEY